MRKNSERSRSVLMAKSAWDVLRRNPSYIEDFRRYQRDLARDIKSQSSVRGRHPNLAKRRAPIIDGAVGRFATTHGMLPIDPAKRFQSLTAQEKQALFGAPQVVNVSPTPDLEDKIQGHVENVLLDPWSTKLVLVVDARGNEKTLVGRVRELIRGKKKSLGLAGFRFRPQDIAAQMAVWSQKKSGASNRRIAKNINMNPDLDYKSRNDRIKDLARAAREKISMPHRILDEARGEIA